MPKLSKRFQNCIIFAQSLQNLILSKLHFSMLPHYALCGKLVDTSVMALGWTALFPSQVVNHTCSAVPALKSAAVSKECFLETSS